MGSKEALRVSKQLESHNHANGSYITNYTTKKQHRSSNASALNKINKKLIQSCANSLSRDHEFSVLVIMSFILGWLDVYLSHYYVAIYWDSAIAALKRAFQESRK